MFRRLIFIALLGLTGSGVSFARGDALFLLNGTYQDTSNTIALGHDGGTLSGSGYTFGLDQGLTLPTGILSNPGIYSIELTFTLDSLQSPRGNGYIKLIDYDDQLSDNGLYVHNGNLDLYSHADGAGASIAAGTSTTVLLTRDASGEVTGSIDNTQVFQFNDSVSGLGVFNGTTPGIRFFEDDTAVTGGQEAGTGTVTRIEIGNTPNGTFTLASPVPLPPSSLGGLVLLGSLGLLKLRRPIPMA